MEYASYLAGEPWSDKPACTHPLLASLARDVNDLTSDARRGDLLFLVPRVVGLYPRSEIFSAEIALIVASEALPIVSMDRQRALGAGLLSLASRTGDATIHELAIEAILQVPDVERWAHSYLDRVQPSLRGWQRSAEAIVHTSTVGIALACVTSPDAHLRAALERSIVAAERAMRSSTKAPDRVLVDG
ncbi:hypothetical protein M2152_001454 [Microbacteriaceae bacterium SG_E_30_P1]|uniref:GGDEF domain-containing protein n=1 Tax=Antiquaquibacter oligotrophicus TaxID=2880260 RepID=A0ABT6KQ91_9MICO|nr:hypothetical protein [Antiquaquibacter oligotrophicus]MDH6181272.1 hypothetical protein [Antiquaquibacter oligotrophicus]UDF13033.1 hypothetical protein LH407_12855 [Antiquaquibacter oligotrophicus]